MQQLCTVQRTDLTVVWIGFCLTDSHWAHFAVLRFIFVYVCIWSRACNTGPISQYRYFGIGKNRCRYTGINTGIQRLPILTVVDATNCKQCVVNDRLMSA